MSDRPTFFDINNRIMGWDGLSLQTRVLWSYLCQMAWANGSCYPSTQTLSKKLQISLTAIKRSKAELIKGKLIRVFHRDRPQTDLFFPFVKFQNIEQRDKNITVLPSVSQTLPDSNKNSDLQEGSVSQTPTQCLTDTRPSVSQTPIKENLKRTVKINTEEEGIEPYANGNGIDTDSPASEPKPESTKRTKKPKISKHRASREEQLATIESQLDTYTSQYPEIDIPFEFENFNYWLTNYPTGKMRKDIFATWKNWLHREHVQLQKRKKQPKQKNKPSIHERGGFNAEAVAAYLIKNARD